MSVVSLSYRSLSYGHLCICIRPTIARLDDGDKTGRFVAEQKKTPDPSVNEMQKMLIASSNSNRSFVIRARLCDACSFVSVCIHIVCARVLCICCPFCARVWLLTLGLSDSTAAAVAVTAAAADAGNNRKF